ncbi:terminal uridylyltransferase 4 isoform X2 [Pyxicephalus adspersus]|uniref:terminal uridylyltransferase 4 isoform X2 n=1 Tax=Pyxicephalus adspersus TaxID=30357 RepID=UPI003B5C0D57
MDGVTKPANHESKKPLARAGRGEARGTQGRVINNQKHKHRGNAKLGRDSDASSSTIVRKGKLMESCDATLLDSNSCSENSINCTSGMANSGEDQEDSCSAGAQSSSPSRAGNLSQPRTTESDQSDQQSKESIETPENPDLGTQSQASPESCPEAKQDIIHSDSHAEPSSDQETTPLTSSPPCKAAENSPSAKPVQSGTLPTDESILADQELGLKQAEERLERDYIYRLEKRSPDFSNCQYLCKLCSIHIENVQGAHKHIKEKRHKKNILGKQEENELRALPPPTADQLEAIGASVANIEKEHGLSQEDYLFREEIVVEMEKIIQNKLPECSLRLYGSSKTRFAFKTSDINIDVRYPPKMSQPDVLIQVLEILKNSSQYIDVESDFHAKVPVIFCKDGKSGLQCKVSAGNETACLTSELLAATGRLEPTLIPLVMAFRYWAKLCQIDCQEEGGIPSYAFALMVVFFLQKRQPPILPTYLGSWIEGFDPKKTDDYHLKGISEEKYVEWEYRPANNDNKSTSGMDARGRADQNHRRTATSEAENRKNKDKMGKCCLKFEQPPQVPMGQLWMELLRMYTLELQMEDLVISVRVQDLVSREAKNWPKRRIAIEDPFSLKRNIARSLNSQLVCEYIQERFRAAYRYFACPQNRESNKIEKNNEEITSQGFGDKVTIGNFPGGKMDINQDGGTTENCILGLKTEGTDKDTGTAQRLHVDSDEAVHSTDQTSALGVKRSQFCNGQGSAVKDLQDTTEVKCVSEAVCPLNEFCSDSCTSTTSHCQMKNKGNLCKDDLFYIFDGFIFTSGKPPTKVCSFCKRDGHSRNKCPEDFKRIALYPLPPMDSTFRSLLDDVCKGCYDELSPSAAEHHNREQILTHLERFIRKEFISNSRLCLFGSSKNGFGFRDSDLDICMTLEGHENAEKLNCKEIIEGLAKVLKRHPGLKNILPITTAKVPIVKFEHRDSGVEGDISLYNTLAQHNTRMLATYAAIDPRVKYLGYTVKYFAKRCDIGDASRGSLSSYAYILMVLYFLQQRNPPVIPVLQEIYDGHVMPRKMVDGWNAFFFDNTDELRKRFPSLGKNTETVGELWLGFLRFYTEEFDFKEHVISIRQKKLLTTFEKQWTSKCIAIEDPFDLNHNLGAGVSRKMTNFIMKAFINGRKLFGYPYYPPFGHEAEYFFDSKNLTNGELAPNDRCCRVCGKIGHYMKDCPKRRRLKKDPNENDDDMVFEDDRELREKRCFTCGDVGHVRRDCPGHNTARHKNASNILGSQILNILGSQQVISSLQQLERPTRTRQSSEPSESQYSSYSPQPQQFHQSSQPQQIKLQQQASQAPNAHQVQKPMYKFRHSPPTHFCSINGVGLLPLPQQIPIHNNSWPIHGQIRTSGKPPHSSGATFTTRSGSNNPPTTNSNSIVLNDPSIIFAQPSARPLSVPTSSHDGQWRNSQTATSLVSNGNVGSTEQGFQGQFGKHHPWDHGNPSHYPVNYGSWPYNLPQNYLQQAPTGFRSKTYYPSGASLIQNGPQFPVLSQGHPHRNAGYIKQKK